VEFRTYQEYRTPLRVWYGIIVGVEYQGHLLGPEVSGYYPGARTFLGLIHMSIMSSYSKMEMNACFLELRPGDAEAVQSMDNMYVYIYK